MTWNLAFSLSKWNSDNKGDTCWNMQSDGFSSHHATSSCTRMCLLGLVLGCSGPSGCGLETKMPLRFSWVLNHHVWWKKQTKTKNECLPSFQATDNSGSPRDKRLLYWRWIMGQCGDRTERDRLSIVWIFREPFETSLSFLIYKVFTLYQTVLSSLIPHSDAYKLAINNRFS